MFVFRCASAMILLAEEECETILEVCLLLCVCYVYSVDYRFIDSSAVDRIKPVNIGYLSLAIYNEMLVVVFELLQAYSL